MISYLIDNLFSFHLTIWLLNYLILGSRDQLLGRFDWIRWMAVRSFTQSQLSPVTNYNNHQGLFLAFHLPSVWDNTEIPSDFIK